MSVVCVYVCGRGWRLELVVVVGCRVCILRVAAVFACDYPLVTWL